MITFNLPKDSPVRSRAAKLPDLGPFLRRACRAVPLPGEISVLITSDEEIRRLNRTFRKKNRSTDVLSFPAHAVPGAPVTLAGDLVLSLDTAARQADRFRHSLLIEIKILLLHGLLHLAGHDHERDRGEMAAREEELRRRFRLPVSLTGRAAAESGGRR